MSNREEFEKWFPVPHGVKWSEKQSDYTYEFIQALQVTANYSGQWQAWQAARAQSGQGVEAVAVIELSDYIHLSGASASQRKALKEVSEGSIQNLPVGTKLYTQPAQQGVPEEVAEAWRKVKGYFHGSVMESSDTVKLIDHHFSATPQPEGDGCCCGETDQAWRLCPEHGPQPPQAGEGDE